MSDLLMTGVGAVAVRSTVAEIRAREREKMGRPYASVHEAWARLKELQEVIKTDLKTLETLHTDVWSAAKEHNEEAAAVNLRAMANTAAALCVTVATIAAEAERAADDCIAVGG